MSQHKKTHVYLGFSHGLLFFWSGLRLRDQMTRLVIAASAAPEFRFAFFEECLDRFLVILGKAGE
jgi:hypothetical protein